MNARLTGGGVPDSRRLNLYRGDPVLARLASLYLPPTCTPTSSRTWTPWAP